jgi:hypothetical protein
VTTETRPDAEIDATAPSTAPHQRPPQRPIAFAVALLFFFGPLGAFVLGERPEEFENRALADLPSVSDGWAFFPDFTDWAVDHLPLRQQAVEANTAFSEGVFGEAPSFGSGSSGGPVAGVPATGGTDDGNEVEYPQVIEGEDGWLYFGGDVSNACDPTRSIEETFEALDRLARAVEQSGRRFVWTVATDKSTVYPDALPETYLGQECAEVRRTEFWEALYDAPPSGYVDLRQSLEAEQRRTGEPVYRRTDTHWAARGAAVYARELARALDPSLLDTTSFHEEGRTSWPGDLGALIGRPSEDEFTAVAVSRPGVRPVGRDDIALPEMSVSGPVTVTNETSGAPLFEPATLLLGDSFSNASRPLLGPLFRQVTVLHNEYAATDPQVAADAMVDADVIVLEIVERTIASGRGAMIDDATLDAVERTLASNPR